MKTLLSLIQLFNLSDGVVALMAAGRCWKVQGKGDNRRSILAVGLAIFFVGWGFIRCGELANTIVFSDDLVKILSSVPQQYTVNAVLLSFGKTLTVWFAWFAISNEVRERKGILSASVIRSTMTKLLDRLR